jgi:hypothetical protein
MRERKAGTMMELAVVSCQEKGRWRQVLSWWPGEILPDECSEFEMRRRNNDHRQVQEVVATGLT